MDCSARTRGNSDTACIYFEFLFVHSESVSTWEDIRDFPSVAVGRIRCSPILSIIIGKPNDIGVASFGVGYSYTSGVSSLTRGDPAVDL